MSAHGEWLDQFEERNAAGGRAGEVEAIRSPANSSSMTSRAPWCTDKVPRGYVVRDANGLALARHFWRLMKLAKARILADLIYSLSTPSTLPVVRLTRCMRVQARHFTASKTSPSFADGSSASHPCTFRRVMGHRKMKVAIPPA
jgi:hypothetical protein